MRRKLYETPSASITIDANVQSTHKFQTNGNPAWINWGDGTVEKIQTGYNSHTYSTPGIYQVTTTGQSTYLTIQNPKEHEITITDVDITKSLYLTSLFIFYNPGINYVDLSKNTLLTNLRCYANNLTGLDISKNKLLTYLACHSNKIGKIDVSNNDMLYFLDCRINEITSITGLSNCTQITNLLCGSNKLNSLDISSLSLLTQLICDNNQLTQLDITHNTALTELLVQKNKIEGRFDTSNCPELKNINISENKITEVDFNSNKNLTRIILSDNLIEEFNLSNQGSIIDLQLTNAHTGRQPNLKRVDISGCEKLEQLLILNSKLEQLRIDNCNALSKLFIYSANNNFPADHTLDLTKFEKLRQLTFNNTWVNIAGLDQFINRSGSYTADIGGMYNAERISFAPEKGGGIKINGVIQSNVDIVRGYAEAVKLDVSLHDYPQVFSVKKLTKDETRNEFDSLIELLYKSRIHNVWQNGSGNIGTIRPSSNYTPAITLPGISKDATSVTVIIECKPDADWFLLPCNNGYFSYDGGNRFRYNNGQIEKPGIKYETVYTEENLEDRKRITVTIPFVSINTLYSYYIEIFENRYDNESDPFISKILSATYQNKG